MNSRMPREGAGIPRYPDKTDASARGQAVEWWQIWGHPNGRSTAALLPPQSETENMSIGTCVKCVHFKRFAGFKLDGPFTIRDGYSDRRDYDSMGLGHCEHPQQPRGLVAAPYSCPNHSTAMVDVTLRQAALTSAK